MNIPLATVEKDFGELVSHGRKAQLGIGCSLARASNVSHYFADSHSANARGGGGQIGDNFRLDPRGARSQARARAPVAA